MMLTPGDLDIAARTVFGEARGESYRGKKAVAHVLINRVNRRVGDPDHSLAAASLRWLQFSAWRESDPNREKMQDATLDDPVFRECVRAVLEALDEPDFTLAARHYHTGAVSPPWSAGKTPCLVIDDHRFFNNVA